MRLLLLAPPGGGKGTQGALLAERFGIAHIATGDLLRAEMDAGTRVGRMAAGYVDRGELVPDDVVLELVLPRVVAAADDGGYALDGFPRSVDQAVVTDRLLTPRGAELEAVVYLPTAGEELVRRLLARALEEGRSDDTPEVIRHRLELYAAETEPLVAYYRERAMLVTVEGNQPVGRVAAAVEAALDRLLSSGGSR